MSPSRLLTNAMLYSFIFSNVFILVWVPVDWEPILGTPGVMWECTLNMFHHLLKYSHPHTHLLEISILTKKKKKAS